MFTAKGPDIHNARRATPKEGLRLVRVWNHVEQFRDFDTEDERFDYIVNNPEWIVYIEAAA